MRISDWSSDVCSSDRLDDYQDRAVEAGPEAGGELVEGDALGGAGRGVAVIGHPDPHVEGRDGDGDHGGQADDGVADRVAADVVGPSPGGRPRGGLGDVGLAVDGEPIDLRAGEAHEARLERRSDEHTSELQSLMT